MAVAISVPPIGVFDPHGDPNSVSTRWTRWVNSFKRFATAAGCVQNAQKRELLLHCAGPDVQDIFEMLTEGDLNTFETALAALNGYFTPHRNTSYNRHIFRQAKQQEDETVSQYVTRLRTLAKDCAFPADQLPDFIRDQVIDNCRSKHLRTKLLAERNLTLERTLDIAMAMSQ